MLNAAVEEAVDRMGCLSFSMTQTPSLYNRVVLEAGTVPKRGLIYLAVGGLTFAGLELLGWSLPDLPLLATAAAVFVFVLGWMLMLYAVSAVMMGRRISAFEALKFVATALLIFLPLLLALFCLWLASVHDHGFAVFLALVSVVFAVGIVSLLPGWPVMQSVSNQWVGPRAAIGATRGMRWPLICAGLVVGGVSRLRPDISPAADVWSAIIVAMIGGIVAMLSGLVATSVAVAAAKAMLQSYRST